MRIPTRNLGCAVLALTALLAWDGTVMTAGSLPGSEAKRLSAQETEAGKSTQDEERMFMEARRALNREEFDLAAELFQALREKYPVTSGHINGIKLGRFVADSYYWEAFGRHREGNLDEARMLLDLVMVYPEAQSRYLDGSRVRTGRLFEEIRNLRSRIRRQLAEQGDPGAAEEVLRDAERVLTVDTAAIRDMRQQYQEQIREAQAQWEVEQERMRRAVQEAIAQYSAQVDSVDLQEVGQRNLELTQQAQLYRSQLARALIAQQLSGPLEHTMDSALVYDFRELPIGFGGNRVWPQVYSSSPEGVLILDPFGGYDPILAGIDIHPECADALIRQQALTSLLRLEADAMSTVHQMLESEDECSAHLRYMSVNWLGGEESEEARDLLIEVARDHPDTRTRQWAVTHLANFESPEVSEVLVSFLRESDDHEVQEAAIYGLYRQESDEATQALIDFASDESKTKLPRQRAAVLVAERAAQGALWWIFDRLDSDDIKSSYLGVVGARAESGELGVASWLLPVVVDVGHSEDVRAAALKAWSRQPSLDLEDVERTYEKLESAELRDQFLYALYEKAESDEENADAVIDKMVELARQETDPEVRRRAVYWLGRTGSERAAAFLQEILRESPNWPTRPAN
ncbi:MAG: HEAT repeat domain-containing protein [Gemmatimonadetes bacterium]|nr:HEAT repeat domain-containing protein [Gemmatimonadota bacterium]